MAFPAAGRDLGAAGSGADQSGAANTGAAPERGAELDQAFAELADPDNPDWQRAEARIQSIWSRTGSAALDLLYQRGIAAFEAGDYDAAIEDLTALTDQDPGFAEGWNARATAYYATGRFGPSLADLDRALALEPRHFGALTGLGIILQDIGRNADAAEAYRRSYALNPHSEAVRQAIGALERALGQADL